MRKWLIAGVLLSLLAWSPFVISELNRSEPEAADAPRPTAQQVEEEELDDILEEIEEPEPALPSEAEAVQPDDAATEEEPEFEEPSEPEGDPEPPRDTYAAADPGSVDLAPRGGALLVLRGAFEGEPRDALWATEQESELRALFEESQVPAEQLVSVVCQRTVCRVELEQANDQQEAMLQFYKLLSEGFGIAAPAPVAPTADPDKPPQLEIYIGRKGYSLEDLQR